MFNKSITIVVAVMVAVVSFYSHAQQSSEIYIPIGKSPGISNVKTLIGKIETVDNQKGIMTITDSSGTYSVKIKNNTRIWLDKSKDRKNNLVGTIADCKPGNSVEIKYKESQKKSSMTADWIKVEVNN